MAQTGQIPIAIRSNPGKYSFTGTARLINAYAEAQGNDGKDRLAVLPCPGLTAFTTVSDTPCRGTIYLPDIDAAYSVHASGVWKVTSDGTATRIGTIPGADVVQISRNQATAPQITILCASGVFYIQSDVVTQVTDPDLPSPVTQDQLAGYTAYGISDRRVFISSINDTSQIDALDFSTAEQSPDPLVRVKGNGGNLVIFKKESTEFWRNTGNMDFPFELVAQGVAKRGILGANSVVDMDNSLFWPTHDYLVCRLEGYTPQRISTGYIERLLQNETSPTSITGFAHFFEGHTLGTFMGSTWTVTYDAQTQVWHERQSWKQSTWRACFPFRAWNKWIFGDTLSGKLLYLDNTSFTEDGNPIVWGMDTPLIVSPSGGGILDWVRVDFAAGQGAVDSAAQGYDPKLMLSWSIDGGNTWKPNRHLSLGKSGKYKTRIHSFRFGRFEDKGVALRLRVSDPIPRAISSIEVGIRPLVQR